VTEKRRAVLLPNRGFNSARGSSRPAEAGDVVCPEVHLHTDTPNYSLTCYTMCSYGPPREAPPPGARPAARVCAKMLVRAGLRSSGEGQNGGRLSPASVFFVLVISSLES
jgi:hypothetical protein